MKLVGCPQTMHQCLLLLTLCVVHVSCQKIGSSLSQISFKTGSQFGGGDTVSLSVNWIIRREDDLRERNAQIPRLKDGNAGDVYRYAVQKAKLCGRVNRSGGAMASHPEIVRIEYDITDGKGFNDASRNIVNVRLFPIHGGNMEFELSLLFEGRLRFHQCLASEGYNRSMGEMMFDEIEKCGHGLNATFGTVCAAYNIQNDMVSFDVISFERKEMKSQGKDVSNGKIIDIGLCDMMLCMFMRLT
eukprot:1054695_1